MMPNCLHWRRRAFWLQKDDQTRNPYFGASMLRCSNRVELIAGDKSSDQTNHDGGHKHE